MRVSFNIVLIEWKWNRSLDKRAIRKADREALREQENRGGDSFFSKMVKEAKEEAKGFGFEKLYWNVA
jgi:hypothetical protein